MTVDLRLAIPAVTAWIVAAVVIAMPSAIPLTIGAWMLAAVVTALALLRPRAWLTVAALAAVAGALCCTSIAVQGSGRQPAVLIEAADSGRQVRAVATITATVLPESDSFAATLEAITVGNTTVRGSIPVLVFGDGPADRIGIGSTVTLAGALTTAEAGDDISFLMVPAAAPGVTAPPPLVLAWANDLRAGFLAGTAELPGDGGDLLAGLAIGDTSAVSDELDSAMKTSSLSHLTAVSGANCAIVIGLIMIAGAALGMPRSARIAASVVVLIAFVILVTPEPSVLRAAVMAAIVLAALATGRPVRGVPVLALATVALLVIDPWLARSYGFALSVLATGGLLLLAGPLAGVLQRWLPRWLSVVIAIPLAAQFACQPVIILLSASLPTYGVVANLLAAPAAPVATVLGLAACIATAVIPPIGTALGWLAWLPSAWIAAIAQFFAELPGARLPWPAGLVGVGLLVLVTAVALLALLWRGPRRRIFALALAACIVGYLGLAGGSRIAAQLGRPADWQIAACDIGQGDAVIVRSAGMTALIDAGPEPARLTHCLSELGISRIDLLVLTHYDLDHVGGAGAVVGRADRVFVGPSDGQDADRLVAQFVSGGATVQQVSRGPTGLLGDLRYSILWPPTRLTGIEPGNPASVTVEFEAVGDCPAGCLSSIFLGDLGEHSQELLLATNRLGEVDVVKVAHHGSADQSERLYQRLHAVVGVIGVGVENGYGHPNPRLLDILARAGTAAARTDTGGMILLAPGTEPGTVSVWTER